MAKRGEPLPINQALNGPRAKLGLDLTAWMAIVFVCVTVFLVGFRLLAMLALPALSVCHYGEQNGDAMRDPEMCFELSFAGGAHLNPYYWRNDYVAIEQWSRFTSDGLYRFHTQLHAEHERFAKLWDRNLRQQGFADVFDPAKHTRG